jgi:hypothetical protein
MPVNRATPRVHPELATIIGKPEDVEDPNGTDEDEKPEKRTKEKPKHADQKK